MFYSPKKSGLIFNALRPAMSIFLSLIMIFQALGPGVFTLKTAAAATTIFSESFGNGSGTSNTVSGWTEVEANSTFAKISDSSGRSNSNKKHVRLTEGASITKTIDVTNFSNLSLSYYWRGDSDAEDSGESQDYLKVYWKKDGDINFTQINSHGNLKDKREDWVSVTLPFSQADGSVIQLRFVGQTTSSTEEARVDDIVVTGTEQENMNICHQTSSENNPWEAIRINASAWDSGPNHEGHGDFLYTGPVNPQNQQPVKPDGDSWCSERSKGHIKIVKTVVGGEAEPTDFEFFIGQTEVNLNTWTAFNPGTYSIGEEGPQGYIATYGEGCANGSVTLSRGQEVVCRITNTWDDEDPEPQPDPENSCLIPDTLKNTDPFVLGTSPEKTLQQILTESGYTLNAQVDQKNFQVWNLDSSAISSTFEVKLLGKYAGNDQVFGYYKKGDVSSFVPIFEVGDHSGYANPTVPVVAVGDSVTVTVPSSFGTSIGFALDSEGGSSQKYFSEIALNADTKDHVASYNPNANSYVVAFEDLPIPGADQDHNDLVVKIYDVRCKQKEVICEPEKELIKNGSFEVPDVATGNYGIFPQATVGLEWFVDWVTGQTSGVLGLEIQDNVAGAPSSGSGDQFAELDGDHPVKIWQDIPTVPGKEYKLSFKYSPRPGQESGTNKIEARADGALLALLSGTGGGATNWSSHSYNFVATDADTEIKFVDIDADNSYGGYIDDVSLRCLPECKPTRGLVVSDTQTIVDNPGETPDAPAQILTSIHSAWTADVDGTSTDAKWVWSENPVAQPDTQVNTTKTFVRTFSITGTPLAGTLNIAADNYYKVWVNNVEVGSELVDENNFQSGTQDSFNVSSLLQTGSNTIKVEVTNKGVEGSDPSSNPAGLTFSLVWEGKDCGDNPPPPDPGSSKIHVQKYVDGSKASFTGENAPSFGLNLSTGNYNANPNLSAPSYEWTSDGIANNQGTVNLSETFSTTVLPNSQECAPGKFYLDGYSIGTSFADASDNATSSNPVFWQSISSDQYVIVWNKSCPTQPTLELSKTAHYATSTGQVTFVIDWKITNGDVSSLIITDPIPSGTTFVSASNSGSTTTNPGSVTWNLGPQTSGSAGAVSFVVGLDAWSNTLKWANGSEQNNQAKRKDGTNILVDRTVASAMFGAPQSAGNLYDTVVNGSFFSLGFDNGNIVVTFGGTIFNGPGNDVKVYEVTGGTSYPDELVKVEAWDGSSWVNLGTVTRDGSVDLGSLVSTNKIRLTDVSTKSLFESTADGYDVDAVEALNILPNICDIKNTVNGNALFGEQGAINASASVTIPINALSCNEEPPCEVDCGGGSTKGTLTVVKVVTNDSQTGTKAVGDFPLFVNQISVVSGVSNQFDPGTYTVTETNNPEEYSATFSGDCNSSGSVTLAAGENKTCTITNNDMPAKIVDECTTGCGGDGGGGGGGSSSTGGGSRSGDYNSSSSGGGGSVAGAFTSSIPNNPEVLGAFTGLPNTGLGPINLAEVSSKVSLPQGVQGSTSATMTILVGIAALIALNFVSIKVLKLHRK